MDKFLSGFGFGTMSSNTPSKPSDGGQSLNTSVNTSPEKNPAKIMGHAAKVNLSLEEKQRLAQQQEQQKLFKSEQTLTSPISSTSRSTVQPKPAVNTGSKSQVKDLTSTLMNSNLSSMGSTQQKTVSSFSNSNSTFSSPGFTGGSTVSSINNKPSGFSSSASGTFGPSGMSGMSIGFGAGCPTKPHTRGSMDLSSLDSLLPSKPRPSLNQLQQTPKAMAPSIGIRQGIMNNNTGTVGMHQRMMGTPRMIDSSGMMIMQQPIGIQPMAAQPNLIFGQQPMNNSQSGTKNDFDTLFG